MIKPVLVAVLAATAVAQDSRPTKTAKQPHGPPYTTAEASVLEQCFGNASEHQAIEDLTISARRWWTRHRLFRVVNYTQPHTPGAQVALDPDGKMIPISSISGRVWLVEGADGFNRVARAERRKKPLKKEEVGDYVGFVLKSLIGYMEPERLVMHAADAKKIVAGEPWYRFAGWSPDKLEIETVKGGWRVRVHYTDFSALHRIDLEIAAADGTLKLGDKVVARSKTFLRRPPERGERRDRR